MFLVDQATDEFAKLRLEENHAADLSNSLMISYGPGAKSLNINIESVLQKFYLLETGYYKFLVEGHFLYVYADQKKKNITIGTCDDWITPNMIELFGEENVD